MAKRLIFLMDVDETATLSNRFFGVHDSKFRYNDALFQAIQNCGIDNRIYLFSAFSLQGIGRTLAHLPLSTPSRTLLIQHLQTRKMQIAKVINFLDPTFDKGLGAYFEQVIKPFEEYVLQGECFENGEDGSKTGIYFAEYQRLCREEIVLRQDKFERLKTHPREEAKGPLFDYTIEQLQKEFPEDTLVFVVFDDKNYELEAIKARNDKLPNPNPLLLVQVKPQHTQAHFDKILKEFLTKEFPHELKERLEYTTSELEAD